MTTGATPGQNLPQTSLYVGDLHPLVSESLLYSEFSEMGHVLSARVCRDVATRASLGYGYVNFEDPKDAERALENMNYEPLHGRPIRIMWSQRDPSLRKSGKGNIFIKNLDKSIEQKELYDTFQTFGKILSCKIAMDEHGNSKGYGFVHFESEKCAQSAIDIVNGKMLKDRIVYVGPFVSSTDRKSTGGKQRFTNCYTKNFAEELDDQKLLAMFSEYGEIKSACVMRDSEGKSKGFGFVCFMEPESAESAVKQLHGKDLNGRALYVCRAQRKDERQDELRQYFESRRAERQAKYVSGVNLYVKNLDDNIDDEQLKKAFSSFGSITSAKVMTDGLSRSKGFGFVCFSQPSEATKAVTDMNGTVLGSKPLYVALAQRKEDRRAKLIAEHQQRMHQYRTTINQLPPTHTVAEYLAHAGFSPAQRFYHAAGAPIATQPRWNRPMAAQMQLAHAMNASAGLRPPMPNAFLNASGVISGMPQNQLSAALVAPQYRNQAAGRGMISGLPPGIQNPSMANAANLIAPGAGGPRQSYGTARASMPPQNMINAVNQGVPQRPTAAAVAASSIRQSVGPPMHRPVVHSNFPGASAAASNVRFNQTARNVSQQQNFPAGMAARSTAFGDQSVQFAQMKESDQKQLLGEQIYKRVDKINPVLASKLTGMLLGMDVPDLLHMVDSDEYLHAKVDEGIAILKSRDAAAQEADSAYSGIDNSKLAGQSGDAGDSTATKKETGKTGQPKKEDVKQENT